MKVLLEHKDEMYDITGYHLIVIATGYSDRSHALEAKKKVGTGEFEDAFDAVWLYQGNYQECLDKFNSIIEAILEGHVSFTIRCDGTPRRLDKEDAE